MVLRRVPAPLRAPLSLGAQCAQGDQWRQWRGRREREEGQGAAKEVRVRFPPVDGLVAE